jgi:hypothetical protein
MPWVIIDEDRIQQKFIFKRNGELIISINGDVIVGKWEYLSSARSLCIDTGNNKLLLNQDFIDSTVMVLKKDGLKGENLILANENLLPTLDVIKYLKNLFYQKNSVATITLSNGNLLEIHYYDGYINYNTVTIETEPIEDCSVETLDLKTRYDITSGKISKVYVKKDYDTKHGKVTIEVQRHCEPQKGDFVLMNNTFAPNGKYKIGFFNTITVENGRII